MANSAKRYRSSFDKEEVDYVRCEVAIYNKLFDEEDWTAKLTLKAVDEKGTKEHCSLEENITVKKKRIFLFPRRLGKCNHRRVLEQGFVQMASVY